MSEDRKPESRTETLEWARATLDPLNYGTDFETRSAIHAVVCVLIDMQADVEAA